MVIIKMNQDNYSPNNPLGGTLEVYDIEREKDLINKLERSEQENNSLKNMEITKTDFVIYLFLALVFGWFLGRITESIALGNLHF